MWWWHNDRFRSLEKFTSAIIGHLLRRSPIVSGILIIIASVVIIIVSVRVSHTWCVYIVLLFMWFSCQYLVIEMLWSHPCYGRRHIAVRTEVAW